MAENGVSFGRASASSRERRDPTSEQGVLGHRHDRDSATAAHGDGEP